MRSRCWAVNVLEEPLAKAKPASYPNWNAAMGARSKQPPRSRREERPAKLQSEAGRVSSAKGSDTRPKPSKAELRSERAAARLEAIERNASSIPPAAMHDVFDVSVPSPGRSRGSSLPPPLPPRGDRRKADRSAFHKPAPHPPRPSKPPVAAPFTAAARQAEANPDSGVELSPNEYEFASDSFGIPPLAAPRTDAPVELRVELPPERFDEQRPARIPYRAIALTSAALMVVVIVAGLTRPKDETPTQAAPAAQKPLAAALAEAANEPSSAASAGSLAPSSIAEPVASAAEVAATAAASSAESSTLVAEPGAAEPLPSAGAGSTVGNARAFRPVAHADAGVAAAFDPALASSSITAAFARASNCLKPGDPRQPATILLTYAPSGRVTSALLSGPYSGTAVGGCIAATLRSARVAPFSGDYVTVKRTSVLK